MDIGKLEQAAARAGISAEFINARGEVQPVSLATRVALLATMSLPVATEPAPLPGYLVLRYQRQQRLAVAGSGDYQWQLTTEQGRQHSGEVTGGQTLALPGNLAHGYHQFLLSQGQKQWHCQLIITPRRCYQPPALAEGKKLWGACIQLYTLRSAANWGMGDFSDLQRLTDEIARHGGAFIGLNPIHALYPAQPEDASPYSPSSRRWLNVLYIDVNAVADFQRSKAAQQWWQQPEVQSRLQAARDSDWVDYESVSALKLTALDLAWQQFCLRDATDADCRRFEEFIHRGGESLLNQACFDALHSALKREDPRNSGWPQWPEAWRQRDSLAVQEFCQQHPQQVRFWQWLQWLAAVQFDACWQRCQKHGMSPGLYRDLAVGVGAGGVETWCDPELYCLQAATGAPPDILGPQGQNWGLPPMDPHILTARACQPFIELLRASMASCGALRIDHVMSLMRLWWVPQGETADRGAYVAYPLDDLIAILALESQRNRCMIIGEDLGTVPLEIIRKLHEYGIFSWKVLYFEQQADGSYRAPADWPRQSMACASTHDLPTLRGFWSTGDLALGEQLGLYPDKLILSRLYSQRAQQKQALLDALHRYGCIPKSSGKRAGTMAMSVMLSRGMQRYIADSNSALLGLQPEDWLDMAHPVNVPGTSDSYPNWRRKLSMTLEEMFADRRMNRLISELNRRRRAPIGEK